MNESHESCRDIYQCSCEELDELTSLAVKNGALGSRLTGAGWGGCTVSLVEDSKVRKFMEEMKNSYYAKEPFKSRAEK
jgi:galactokinase